mmetsp:Transcript_20256/g.61480  ORF Transcript_20256/g.61480 Transcript_20256/m.61480 type:complete len:134 (-) Transcript_20256:1666-2067(-)
MSGFAAPPAAEPPLREQLSDLMERRSALEEEVSGIVAELQSPGPGGAPAAGLDAPLVDREGFPRADIDVYRVTHQRQRLAFIRTDHKEITGQVRAQAATLWKAPRPDLSLLDPPPLDREVAARAARGRRRRWR